MKGQNKKLELEDVEPNLKQNEAKLLGNELDAALSIQIAKAAKKPLRRALFSVYGNSVLLLGLAGLFKDGFWA